MKPSWLQTAFQRAIVKGHGYVKQNWVTASWRFAGLASQKLREGEEGFVGCIAGETGNKEVGKTYCFINNW